MSVSRLSRLSAANKGFLAIIGGTGGGQLAALLAAPLLSRLFSPDVYGPFAVVNALVLPLATVAALRYELAIPVARPDEDAAALASLGLRVVAGMGIGLTPALLLTGPTVAGWVGLTPQDSSLLLWVPVVGSLMGAFVVLNQLAIRARMYTAIARRNLLQAVTVTALQLLAGVLGAGAHGLAGGLAGGQAVGVMALALSLRGELGRPVAPGRRRAVAREFARFPLLMAPAGLINNLGIQVPVLLASVELGQQVSGWLGMTQRILVLPVSLLGLAMAQVFLGEFAAAHRAGSRQLMTLFMTTSRRLALAGGTLAAIVLLAGPTLAPLVLGEEWARSGAYAQALALAMAAQMVASPLSQAIIVTGQVQLQAMWDVFRLVAAGGAMLFGARFLGSDVAAVWSLSIATIITYSFLWLLARHCVARASSLAQAGGADKNVARRRGLRRA